jgi:hypothetical protein
LGAKVASTYNLSHFYEKFIDGNLLIDEDNQLVIASEQFKQLLA